MISHKDRQIVTQQCHSEDACTFRLVVCRDMLSPVALCFSETSTQRVCAVMTCLSCTVYDLINAQSSLGLVNVCARRTAHCISVIAALCSLQLSTVVLQVMPQELLSKCVNERVWIIMKNSREVVGVLKGYDVYVNMVLEQVTEYERTSQGVVKNNLEKILLNGNNVAVLVPGGDPEQST